MSNNTFQFFNGGTESWLESQLTKPHQSVELSKQQVNNTAKPLVSLIAPAYNEALIVDRNLEIICDYMSSLEQYYRWELIVVNDGSRDDTGARAEVFAKKYENVFVIHHLHNGGLGQALQTGFEHSRGDYILTLDMDLSYSPEHIERLLRHIQETGSKVVIASPYMKGGKVTNVPWLRRVLSIWGNRFLSFMAKLKIATLTGMVRAYDGDFIRSLKLKSMGMEVQPEILHKARLLNAKVTEIPGHLKWSLQKGQPKAKRRRSSMRILSHIWEIFFAGFLLRPVIFFIIPSLLFLLLAIFANMWVLIHCWTFYQQLAQQTPFPDPTVAVAQAFRYAPHTFFIGGTSLMISIQLFSLGILSAQSKSYFEEIFYLGANLSKAMRQGSKINEQ
jgi:glycosyltransferase involved in cell wall biosynthesis